MCLIASVQQAGISLPFCVQVSVLVELYQCSDAPEPPATKQLSFSLIMLCGLPLLILGLELVGYS